MDVYELVEKLGGEVVRGKARIRQGREYIVIGTLNGDDMVFTEEGRQLAAGSTVEPKKRGRPSKANVVESGETVVEQEVAPVAQTEE